jgi:peptide/nickel transport system ATP-binding protein
MSAAAVAPKVELPVAGSPPASAPELAETPASPVASAATARPEDGVVLDVRDLRTYFYTYDGVVKALDGVTLKLRRGETTGLVGETGCGKSVTAFSVTRLIADPPGRIVHGSVVFRGADLLWGLEGEAKFRPVRGTPRVKVSRRFRRIRRASERMEAVRGRGIAMIFQEPTQAMNPVFSIANQVGEILFLHRGAEIVDEMLGARPDAPEVEPALQRLLAAIGARKRPEIRAAAEALGAAVRSPRLGTEAYYIGLAAVRPSTTRAELHRAIDRVRLRPTQRAYLLHRRRLLAIRDEENRVHLEEMRERTSRPGAVGRLRLRRTSERLRHLHYRLWGVRGWVQRPLEQTLFWRVVRILESVQIANPPQVARGYPHELSGGMLQRVMIAMALSADPDILLADEPTTALDVTIQAQILELLGALRRRVGTAILLITHDLAVVAEVADRVCVMYAGQIVEQGPVRELFRRPLHPYTQGLLASVPRVDQPGKDLRTISGSVPNLIDPPTGCRFHPRCPHAMPVCRVDRPPMTDEGAGHTVACYLYHGRPVGE